MGQKQSTWISGHWVFPWEAWDEIQNVFNHKFYFFWVFLSCWPYTWHIFKWFQSHRPNFYSQKKILKVFMELFCTLPWSRLFGVWWSKTQSVSKESFPRLPHLWSNQTCLISSQVFSLAFGVELKTQWQHVFRCERLSNIDLLKVFKILSKSPRVRLASAT